MWLLAPLALLDVPRYTLVSVVVCAQDLWHDFWLCVRREPAVAEYSYCPSVCAVIVGLNEVQSIYHTLKSVQGSYPNLEIIVVDDGSTDGMTEVALRFARQVQDVSVIRNAKRAGKSAGLNLALAHTQAEVIVCIDADSTLGQNAIWEIVQPLEDRKIGAVAGSIAGRDPFHNLCTWLQGLEYLRCIFVGRRFTARAGILSIVSGAFGAFRRSALEQVGGWDVGPGEDGDVVLRLRKSGYGIDFAPYAQCNTGLVTSWTRLIKQRRRWEWAVVTFECRKHLDIANPTLSNFRWSNLTLFVDRFLYSVLFQYLFVAYQCWLLYNLHEYTVHQYVLYYFVFLLMELIQMLVVLYYSNNRNRDLLLSLAFPLIPFYYFAMRVVTLIAVTEELLLRRSFRDNFVPRQVRNATWQW